MKYIDIVVQTVLFLWALGVLIFTFGQAGYPYDLLFPQMLLGPWQLIGSLIILVRRTKHYKLLVPYHIISWGVVLALASPHVPRQDSLLLFGAPWVLATYYYAVSWKMLLAKQDKGKFLPHLSF